MPKSRKRRFGFASKSHGAHTRSRGVSGDPRKRPAPPPSSEDEERVLLAATLLRNAAAAPLADPLAFTALPPLVLHTFRTAHPGVFPAANCVDECLILASAYAEMGIETQVRTAELTVTDGKTGAMAAHGIPRPHWQDGRFFGHTVLWLPEHRHLVDPAAERYREIAAWKAGPVVAAAGPESDDEIAVIRGYLRLAYTVGSKAASDEVLDDPAARDQRDDDQAHGLNIASEVIWLLATERPPADTAEIGYPRARALVDAVRGTDRHGNIGEDVYFEQRSGDLAAAGPIRLHHLTAPTV